MSDLSFQQYWITQSTESDLGQDRSMQSQVLLFPSAQGVFLGSKIVLISCFSKIVGGKKKYRLQNTKILITYRIKPSIGLF